MLTESGPQTPDDAQVKAVLDKMAAAGITRPTTVADVRKAYLFYPKLSGTPEHVFHIEDRQIPGPLGNITVRVYTPTPTSGLPILVFFHGGGFVAGNLDTHDNPLRSVTNLCECIVVSVDYRLAPENKYPAAPEDAYSATKWVAEHAGDIGGDPRRIAVGGDGAGGNLAAVVTLMARERGMPSLVFQILIYPMLDASTMRPSWFTESDAPTVTRESKHKLLSTYLPITANLGDSFIRRVSTTLRQVLTEFSERFSFPQGNFAPGSLSNDDRQLGRPTASPLFLFHLPLPTGSGSGVGTGLLIQTALGRTGGLGALRTKRSG